MKRWFSYLCLGIAVVLALSLCALFGILCPCGCSESGVREDRIEQQAPTCPDGKCPYRREAKPWAPKALGA